MIIWLNGGFGAVKSTPAGELGRQPAGTLMLRSGRLTPDELADEVLAALASRRVS